MALVLADRVLETCTSPGTGAVTLLGATTGYQSFSNGIGDGNTCYYCIADQGGANWEVGIGTYNSVGNTLTRTTPISGSAATPVNFSSGTQNVFVTYPAEKSVNLDGSGKLRADSNSYLDFASAAPATIAGRMWYNDTTGSWNLGMGGGNITQQIGEELFIYGKASSAISGETLLQLIFKTGTVGASGVLQFAPTTAGITDANLILGVATEDISAGNFGRITTFGIVRGINTTGSTYSETWSDGDTIWYNPTTGGLTKTEPTAPNIKYQVGTILTADASTGSFQVDLHPGSVLGGTDSNVQFGTLSTNNLIQYNGTYWTNVAPSSVTGVGSVANAVTFNNSGSGASSGTTFDGSAARTISYNTIGAQPAGTYVTSVTGTSPVVSSGGTTPAISMPQASGSVSGYLSSTDWTTFNSKGSGTVTSVSGTGTASGLTLSGTVTTSGSLTLSGTVNSLAAGTYGINISGNAATVSNITRGSAGSLDLNTVTTSGFYRVNDANANRPGDYGQLLVVYGGSDTIGQLYFDYSTGNTFSRAGNPSNVGGGGSWSPWRTNLTNNNYNSYAPTLTGTGASGTWGISITGNSATATTLSGDQTNWASLRSSAVANMLGWKNYGNNHVIFDASQSTSPTGSAVNNTNAQVAWGATYPTLMGWNGINTYGVRVDSARIADTLTTGNNYQVNSLGVGTAASGTAGEIRATNNITAYYSDGRLKTVVGKIDGALSAVQKINGVYYTGNETAAEFGYDTEEVQVGVIAQEIQAVLPQVVTRAPFDIAQDEDGNEYSKSGKNYLTVRYEKLIPLLVEAIKEQQIQIDALRQQIEANAG